MPEPPLQLLLSSGELRFRHLKVAVKKRKKKKKKIIFLFANYNEAHSPLTWVIHFHDTILWEPHLHIS